MIGSASLEKRQYKLPTQVTVHVGDLNSVCNVVQKPTSTCKPNNSLIDKSRLWHMRLGHISHNRNQYIATQFPFIQCDNTKILCDVCHFSK